MKSNAYALPVALALAVCSCGGSTTTSPGDASTALSDAVPEAPADTYTANGFTGFDAGDDGDVDAPARVCSGATTSSQCLGPSNFLQTQHVCNQPFYPSGCGVDAGRD